MERSPKPESDERREIIRAESQPGRADASASDPTEFEQTERFDQSPSGVERRERTVVDRSGGEHRESIVHDHLAEQQLILFKAEQLVWLIFGIIEVLIGLRIVLKLIAANPANAFANFIYSFAAIFLEPFFGLTRNLAADGMVLEVSSLIAMIVYALVAWAIVKVIRMLFVRAGTRSVSTYDRYRS